MKRKLYLCAIASLLFSMGACKKEALIEPANEKPGERMQIISSSYLSDYCGDYITEGLISGNPNNPSPSGTVNISNNAAYIQVDFNAPTGWQVISYELYAGHPDSVPMTGGGSPKNANFPYTGSSSAHSISKSNFTYDTLLITAKVIISTTSGPVQIKETWTSGTRFRSNNIASWFNYEIQSCPVSCNYSTFGQGGWGNSGSYCSSIMYNGMSCFPLMIGCSTGYNVTYTAPQAVTDCLPCSSTPSCLQESGTDPGSEMTVLAGQIVALTLNLINEPNLGSLKVAEAGAFQGWTVTQALEEANNTLGGCSTTYSPSRINKLITSINENYEDGEVDRGFLSCGN